MVVDGDFLSGDPRELMLEGSGNQYDLITGFTHHDFAGFTYVNPLGFPNIDAFINLAKTQVRTTSVTRPLEHITPYKKSTHF